jgi:hypothetical protein
MYCFRRFADSIRLHDIIAEIISTVITHPPQNPFEINHAYYDELPLEESAVCAGAMLDFLQKIFLSSCSYAMQGTVPLLSNLCRLLILTDSKIIGL